MGGTRTERQMERGREGRMEVDIMRGKSEGEGGILGGGT